MNVEDLLKGKMYRKGTTLFPSTEQLVTPFLSQLPDEVELRIKAVKPIEGTAEESEIDETFTKVLIEAVFPSEVDTYRKTVGLLYGLDVQIPVMKIYNGWENQACLNLCVFNPIDIQKKSLNDSDFQTIYDSVPIYVNKIEEDIRKLEEAMNFLSSQIYQEDSLDQILGYLATKCVTNTGLTSAYINAVNFLTSPKNKNEVNNIYYKQDKIYSALDIYGALTATPSAKKMDKSEDVLTIYNLFCPN